ncbi:MAG: hypothetical protein JSV51_04810 [Candidatus Bathyarchaeota archaeon]|nr:MAG: hypothetical protein JSV51_04810 [Candidatus Bathyarchaeota archaeon]
MGGTSEREFSEKLTRLQEKLNKRARDVHKKFQQIEKMKTESLKESEKMRNSADHDLIKIEKDIAKSKDLAPESKQRLQVEISALRHEIEEMYYQLSRKISETIIPVAEQINY